MRRFSSLARFKLPAVKNEPMLDYAPGSVERANLRAALTKMKNEVIEIPCVVDGKDVFTGDVKQQVIPSNHGHVLANFHLATPEVCQDAIKSCAAAKDAWAAMPFEDRAAIFRKAADLLAGKHRAGILASTMLATGKNIWQGEIDSSVEMIDFLRFNCLFAERIYDMQPDFSTPDCWNRSEYRPLEGFVLAVTPFNFLAIGGNLSSSPALMGNTVVWKPASTAVLSNYYVYNVFREAGLPDGVINFLPSSGRVIGNATVNHPDFAGLHFTGGTDTFNGLWQQIGSNLDKYKGYPRVVGETGGKNGHFIHPTADIAHAAIQTIRGGFEYSGQKCSATSRVYCPDTLWPEFKEHLLAMHKEIKVGHVDDFEIFLSAVIDEASFDNIKKHIDIAKESPDAEIIAGGNCDKSVGYMIEPTIILAKDPKFITMSEELFGPVITIHVYDANDVDGALKLHDETSPYGLTGSIFAQDRQAINHCSYALRNACGNLYINDKSTGAVVGQQPFGGARASGTNDKAGSLLNLLRWVSPRTIKETFHPVSSFKYPSMSSLP
jgi:1-pyrroline-5-carboxylate dehydrogenase